MTPLHRKCFPSVETKIENIIIIQEICVLCKLTIVAFMFSTILKEYQM